MLPTGAEEDRIGYKKTWPSRSAAVSSFGHGLIVSREGFHALGVRILARDELNTGRRRRDRSGCGAGWCER